MALADQIIGAESGGNATARNPRSSATGAGQFISGTWLDMVGRYRPDLAGLPKDQILALRNDPALSKEMVNHYADENGAKIEAAGFPATPGNKYLGHFAGPTGAISVLGADPSTPVSQVLPPASIAANPFLNGMSAGDLQGWAARKVGDTSPAMTTPGAPPVTGALGVAGPTTSGTPDSVTPAAGATMATPAESPTQDDGPDVAAILKALGSVGGTASPIAQAAAAPAAPSILQPPRQAAPTFDAKRFFSLLPNARR